MAKKITINSNVKLVTSGTAPTLENLKKGEMAFGQENGSLKLWGNPDGNGVVTLEPHVDFSLQEFSSDLIMVCKKGEILPSDEVYFYRKGKYLTKTDHYLHPGRAAFKKQGWRHSVNSKTDGVFGYETFIPRKFDKVKFSPGDETPIYEGMDIWKLTAHPEQDDWSGSLRDLFRASMVRVDYNYNGTGDWAIRVRNGREGRKFQWYDYEDVPYEINKTVQAGVAIWRDGKKISDIIPFKIRFHLLRSDVTAQNPPEVDSAFVQVTFRI